MKTRELIQQLKSVDPSGEAEVILSGSGAVWYAEKHEGYWDGAYEILHLDDRDFPTGMTISRKGWKVLIRSLNIPGLIELVPEAEIDYDGLSTWMELNYRDRVDAERALANEIAESLELEEVAEEQRRPAAGVCRIAGSEDCA